LERQGEARRNPISRNFAELTETGERSVYRRKDGRCAGENEDANGKRRYISGKTKAEVRAKLRKQLADTHSKLEVERYTAVNTNLSMLACGLLDSEAYSGFQRYWTFVIR
jgi:hypothetical protein